MKKWVNSKGDENVHGEDYDDYIEGSMVSSIFISK